MRLGDLVLAIATAATVTASGCCAIAWQGPYEGRITDAKTGEPIRGAVIAAFWSRYGPWLGHDWNAAYDGQEAVTREDGKFYLPGIHRVNLMPFSCVDEAVFTIFAEGYHGCGMISEQAEGGCGQPEVQLMPTSEPRDPWLRDLVYVPAEFQHFAPQMLGAMRRERAARGANPKKEDSHSWSSGSSSSWHSP
jgi:hypothetical protein